MNLLYYMLSAFENLGKPNLLNRQAFTPKQNPALDILFKPIKNPAGNVNYVPLVSTEEDKDKDKDEDDSEFVSIPSETVEPVIQEEMTTCAAPDAGDDNKNPNNIFSLGGDPIKTFYIGSITVVGLFILYRMLTKKV